MTKAGAYCLSLLLILCIWTPAAARTPPMSPEGEVRAVVARWYAELGKEEKGRMWSLTAPGFIDASPHYRYVDTGAARLGPRVFTSLAAQALKFTYEIEAIRLDSSFAKLRVWERGYFFAAAAQKTYERAAATVFILERQEKDGRWLILAHQSSSQGIPPNKITSPMPDLRDLYYATEGKDRDPARDAEAARKF
jgi:hypothetical protein